MTSTPDTDLPDLARRYAADGYVLVKGLLSRDEAAFYRRRSHERSTKLPHSSSDVCT